MPHPEQENNPEVSAEAEQRYELPPPHLMDALATASGDILVSNAQKAEGSEPRLVNYLHDESPAYRIYGTSERSYLSALQNTLAEALAEAKKHDPNEVAFEWHDEKLADETYGDLAEEVADFADKLVYINNAEFEKATDIMAERILADAENGNAVAIYDYKDRSPRFVMTKVLEKVRRTLESPSNYSPDEAEKLRARIICDDYPDRLVQRSLKAHEGAEHTKFYVIDDFVVSGNMMSGAINTLSKKLDDETVNHLGVQDGVVGLVICGRPRQSTSENDSSVEPVFPYDERAKFSWTGMAVAGSWSSTDYGYQNFLELVSKRLNVSMAIDRDIDWPVGSHKIKGRYEKGEDGQYLDPQYREEYERVKMTFGPAQ